MTRQASTRRSKGRHIVGQTRIPGQRRERVGAAVEREIDRAVKAEARREGVSRSYVIKVRLAEAFGIPLERDNTYRALRLALRLVRRG